MKTNHRRQFVETGVKRVRYERREKKLPVGLGSIKVVYGGDATLGHRGEARSKRGAKKFIRNQVRKTKAAHIKKSMDEE